MSDNKAREERYQRGYAAGRADALRTPSERERALEAALRRIAAMDYRGNEPEEQRIARAALAQPAPGEEE